jgi:hypothetical protein
MKLIPVTLTAAAMVAVASSAAACGHPLIPASALGKPTATTPSAAPAPTPATVNYRPRKPLIGVDLFALSNYSPAAVTFYGDRTLRYLKYVLHADAVGISWNFYATTDSSNRVLTTRRTLSASNVAILIRIAKALKLKVELRPQIVVTGESNTWEGRILPANQTTWFTSYYRAELPYLRVAQHLGIWEFVTANEMHKMNGSALWGWFLGKVRKVYHGVVSYTAWDEDYLPTAAQILPVRLLGTNMYRPVFLSDSAPLRQVTAAWEAYFRYVPASVRYRTAIDETGIAAKAGAYRHPGDLYQNSRSVRDEQVQINWFLAACHTVLHYRMRGVFFWKVDLTDNPVHPATSLSTFEGQKGALAIRECAKLIHAAW